MISQMKPWTELSPSGRRYRIKSWENEALSGIDVFCKGNIDMPSEDLVVSGDLHVNGNLICQSLHVHGSLYVSNVIKTHGQISVDGDLDAGFVYATSLIVNGASKASAIKAKEIDVNSLDVSSIYCINLYYFGSLNVHFGAQIRESIIQKKARA